MIYRLIFTFIVPVAFLTTFPADMMIGRNEFEHVIGAHRYVLLAIAVTMAAGLLLMSRVFWRFALRFYTSASS
jgi:ABC-2 type transport system permease protein